jgi:hypothetical protein
MSWIVESAPWVTSEEPGQATALDGGFEPRMRQGLIDAVEARCGDKDGFMGNQRPAGCLLTPGETL